MPTHSYEQYRKLGGVLDRISFQRLLSKAGMDIREAKTSISEVAAIARVSEIEVDCSDKVSDERVVLYRLLRTNSIADAKQKITTSRCATCRYLPRHCA